MKIKLTRTKDSPWVDVLFSQGDRSTRRYVHEATFVLLNPFDPDCKGLKFKSFLSAVRAARKSIHFR